MLGTVVEPICKVGSKILVSRQLLEEIQSQLVGLPEKQKNQLEIKEAVAFLYQGVQSAIQKNYSTDEITALIRSAGWVSKDNSMKHFWRLFRSEDKNSKNRKITPMKTVSKDRHDQTQEAIKHGKNVSAEIPEACSKLTETNAPATKGTQKNTPIENTQRESPIEKTTPVSAQPKSEKIVATPPDGTGKDAALPQNSAHFELPPDTDDL